MCCYKLHIDDFYSTPTVSATCTASETRAGGHETGEVVGAKHHLRLGYFRQEELGEDPVEIEMFFIYRLSCHKDDQDIQYRTVTCIYIYMYTHNFGGKASGTLRHANLVSDYHNCFATWLSRRCLNDWVPNGWIYPRGQHPKAPNFKRESGLSPQHFLQGAGAVLCLVWEILQEMDFQKNIWWFRPVVLSNSHFLFSTLYGAERSAAEDLGLRVCFA